LESMKGCEKGGGPCRNTGGAGAAAGRAVGRQTKARGDKTVKG